MASGSITVQTQADLGIPVAVTGNTTIDLTSNSGTGKFDTASDGSFVTTSVTILASADSVTFFYKDNTSGTPTLTATENPAASPDWTNGTQQQTINAAAANKIAVTTQPSTTTVAGVNLAQQPVVKIQDQFGNTVTSSALVVTVNLQVGDGTLSGVVAVTASSGVVTYSGLSIDKTGTNKKLRFTQSSLPNQTVDSSPDFAITFAAANKLAVTTSPSASTVAGVNFAQQPVVKIQDQFGNTVTDSTLTVTVSLQTGDGTLSGAGGVAASSGVVTYAGLSIDKTGTNKVLRFTQSTLTNQTVDTSAITITFAAFSKLAVTTQPSSSTAATVAFAQQPIVKIQDQFGNTVTNSTLTVTASRQAGDATLNGTLAVAAVNGVVTYSGLSFDSTGTDKVIRFTQGAKTVDTSAFTITISVGALDPTNVQPASLIAGVVGNATVTFTLGNALPANGKVIIIFQSGFAVSSGGTTALGTLSANLDGATTITNIDTGNRKITITRSGGNQINAGGAVSIVLTKIKNPTAIGSTGTYSLETTDTGNTTIDQDLVVTADTITHAGASALVLTTAPSSSTVAGVAFATQPVITVRDAFGNTVSTGDDATQTITASKTTGNGTLSGTLTKETTNGVANFSGNGMKINLVGTDKALTFEGSKNGSSTTSSSLTITHAAASVLVVTTQPSSSTVAGVAIATQPVVTVRDEFGNTVTTGADSTQTISATLTAGIGTLTGTTTKPATAGVANFSGNGLKINLVGTNKKLTFAGTGGGSSGTTSAFTITFAALKQLGVLTQPTTGSTVAGVAFARQPVVAVQDEFGNTITNSTLTVAASLQTGSGALSGTKSVAAVNGLATYSGLSINLVGTNKVLRFTQDSLTTKTVDSAPALTITAAAVNKLAMTNPSTTTVAGVSFAEQPTVKIQDEFGNTVTSSTLTVTASLQTGTGTLSGTKGVAAVNGVVTYAGLSINLTGTNKVIRFTQSSLTNKTADTSSFTITFAVYNKIGVTTQPSSSSGVGSTSAQQPVVAIHDQFGNTVADSTLTVTANLQSGEGTLNGTTAVAAVNGVVTYSGLSIDTVGAGKVLRFTQGANTADTSTFTIASNRKVADPLADLGITGSANSTTAVIGKNLTYSFKITNFGPDNALSVKIVDALPAGVSFVSSSASAGECSGKETVTCVLGDMGSLQPVTVTIVVRLDAEETVVNTAAVSGSRKDPGPNSNTATVTTKVLSPLTVKFTYEPDRDVKPGDTVVITATFNRAPGYTPTIFIDTQGEDSGLISMKSTDDDSVWTYTYVVPKNSDGEVTVTINELTDKSDDGDDTTDESTDNSDDNDQKTNNTFTIDGTGPSVALTYEPEGSVAAGDTLVITATFDQVIKGTPKISIDTTGIDLSAVVMTDSGDGKTWTYSYTAPADSAGLAKVTISGGEDEAGNPNLPASGGSFTIGPKQIRTSLTYEPDKNIVPGSTVVITATFDGSFTGTPNINIDILGPDLGPLVMTKSEDGLVWTFTYVAPEGSEGEAKVSITGLTGGSNNQTIKLTNDAFTIIENTTDLSIAVTASSDSVVRRGELTYTITVINRGPATATGVTLVNDLPGGVTLDFFAPQFLDCNEVSGPVR